MAESEAGERLLSIPLARHGGEAFPTDVDITPSGDRYVGFFENQHGEQLVFVSGARRGPMLYQGDNGWTPVAAEWPEISSAILLHHLDPGKMPQTKTSERIRYFWL